LTEAGTGSCLLEDGNQNNREQESVVRITDNNHIQKQQFESSSLLQQKFYLETDKIHKQYKTYTHWFIVLKAQKSVVISIINSGKT
jgi:hypothetical protein